MGKFFTVLQIILNFIAFGIVKQDLITHNSALKPAVVRLTRKIIIQEMEDCRAACELCKKGDLDKGIKKRWICLEKT